MIGATALATGLLLALGSAFADDGKYPDFNGQWRRPPGPRSERIGAPFDPSKPFGREEKPPLTPEYQKIYDDNLVDMEQGGQGIDPTYTCLSPGMPRVMIPYIGMEFVVTPAATYIMFERDWDFNRHIYTDGRGFPDTMALDPKYLGYSIGKWVDSTGSGNFDTLEVETRGMKGPRALDVNGLPVHRDNQTIVTERIFLDRQSRDLLHDQVTVIDHAYTRPWTVLRSYAREANPNWVENNCAAGNHYAVIGNETYFISADGHLMPTKKNQAAPDLRRFGKN